MDALELVDQLLPRIESLLAERDDLRVQVRQARDEIESLRIDLTNLRDGLAEREGRLEAAAARVRGLLDRLDAET